MPLAYKTAFNCWKMWRRRVMKRFVSFMREKFKWPPLEKLWPSAFQKFEVIAFMLRLKRGVGERRLNKAQFSTYLDHKVLLNLEDVCNFSAKLDYKILQNLKRNNNYDLIYWFNCKDQSKCIKVICSNRIKILPFISFSVMTTTDSSY